MTREIEYETPEYFILKFNQNVSRWLPVYNKLYESSLLELDKMKSYSRESSRNGDRETNASGKAQAKVTTKMFLMIRRKTLDKRGLCNYNNSR